MLQFLYVDGLTNFNRPLSLINFFYKSPVIYPEFRWVKTMNLHKEEILRTYHESGDRTLVSVVGKKGPSAAGIIVNCRKNQYRLYVTSNFKTYFKRVPNAKELNQP